MPDPETPQFWEMYRTLTGREPAPMPPKTNGRPVSKKLRAATVVGDGKRVDYETAKFPRRRKSSRIGLITFQQYLIEIVRSGRNRAKKKNVPYDIDVQYVLGMARQQDFRCALTGIRFFIET
jgi:hypothetical protein